MPATLADFPISQRWVPQNPDAIQLYFGPTPNGLKVSIMLEETGLPYEIQPVDFGKGDQRSAEFLSISPNNKIPAIIDPHGPGGVPLPLFESGAILMYLAEKSGQLMPADKKWEITQWLMFQMSGLGPMFGQFGFFYKYGGKEIEDPRPREKYRAECERLLNVLDRALEGRAWICGDYSIADIAIGPWLHGFVHYYQGGDQVGWDQLRNVPGYFDRFLERPAVQRAYQGN